VAQINGWLMIPDPFANALFARPGWDSITIDCQHGMFDEAAAVHTLHTLQQARPRRLVRVPSNEPGVIGKMLDAGADGIIAPMINSVAEATALAQACWYSPKGSRSFGPTLAALRTGGLPYEDAAAHIEVWAMIETRTAFAAVAGIAAVEGITGLFVGPSDLALAFGMRPGPDREEGEIIDAYHAIIAAARAAGKASGIYCARPAYALRMAALGFDMVTAATDATALPQAATAAIAAMRQDPQECP
jgi:4-hydroxy-2-oxoheptanedioate aldolase